MKYNDWNKSLEFGNKGEEFVKNHFKKVFEPIITRLLNIKQYSYNLKEDIAKQKAGCDGNIKIRPLLFDVKVRTLEAMKYHDILLETVSIIKYNKPGWFFTSKSDVIAYLFADFSNGSTSHVESGYLIILKKARKIFTNEVLENFKIIESVTKNGNETWRTRNRAVDIDDFPKGSLININKIISHIKERKKKRNTLERWF